MNADLDEPIDELDGLTRREFAVKYGLDARFVATEPTPPLDEQRRLVADALGVNPAYIDPALLVESDVNHV